MIIHLTLLFAMLNGIPAQDSHGTPRYDASRFYEINPAAEFNFSTVEKRVTTAFKRNEFRKIRDGVKESIAANNGPGPVPDSVTRAMHFLDLNNDGRDDLIVQMTESGWPVTYVYLNRGGSYFATIHATGPIVELRPAARSIVLCDVKCGGYSMEDYELHYALDTMKAVLTKKIQFSQGTLFPRRRPARCEAMRRWTGSALSEGHDGNCSCGTQRLIVRGMVLPRHEQQTEAVDRHR